MKNEIQMLDGITSGQVELIKQYQDFYDIIFRRLEALFIKEWKEYNDKLTNNGK